MRIHCVGCVSLFALAGLAASAAGQDISQVNAYRSDARIFNDFPASGLTINGVNRPIQDSQPLPFGPVHYIEQFPQGIPGNFANKHVAWLSYDGGATRADTNQFQSWTLEFDVTMNGAGPGPRKEAGIEIHQPRPGLGFTDEGQVLIASDGEVAVFGATLPFTGFGGGTYTFGTMAHVIFDYMAPGVVDPTKGAYRLRFMDAVTGLHDSGNKIWGAEPDGIVGLTHAFVGLKDQNQRNPFINDFSDVFYNNVLLVPTPGAMALLGLAGLVIGRRRR